MKTAQISGASPSRYTVDVTIEDGSPIEVPVLHSTWYKGAGAYWHPFLLAPIGSKKVKRLLTSLITSDVAVIQIDSEDSMDQLRPASVNDLQLSRNGYLGVFQCAFVAAGMEIGLRADIGPKIAEIV